MVINRNVINSPISEDALRALRVETHVTFGRTFLQKGHYDRALGSFREALELDAADVRALTGVSFALARLRRYEDALATANDIIRIKPTHAGAYTARGVCLHAMGKETEAEAAFRQSVAVGGDDASAHYNFACYWADRHRPDLCREYLREALRIKPDMNVVAATDVDLQPYRAEVWFQDLVAFRK